MQSRRKDQPGRWLLSFDLDKSNNACCWQVWIQWEKNDSWSIFASKIAIGYQNCHGFIISIAYSRKQMGKHMTKGDLKKWRLLFLFVLINVFLVISLIIKILFYNFSNFIPVILFKQLNFFARVKSSFVVNSVQRTWPIKFHTLATNDRIERWKRVTWLRL